MEESGLRLVAEGADKFFGDMDKAAGSVDKFADTTDKGASKVNDFAKTADGAGSKFAAFGGIVAGGAAIAGAALIGVGAAAIDMASQTNQATNDFQAQLGASREEAERLTDVARNIFGNNFGADMNDAAQSVIIVRQQIKGLAEEDLQGATEAALALRDVFGIEVPESTAAVNTLMTEFGLTSKEAFDFVTAGFQRGLNSSDDFLDTIGEYSNLFAASDFTAAEFFSTMETGLRGGVLGTDKIADAMKEFGIRMREIPDNVFGPEGSLIHDLGMTRDEISTLVDGLTDGSLSIADFYDTVVPKIAALDDPIQQNAVGVQLFGTQWEDLGAAAILGVDMARTSLDDLAGATDGLSTKYANLQSVGDTLWRQTLLTLEPVGAALLDLANAAMPSILEGFENLRGVLESVVGPTADFLAALGGDQEALNSLPGGLQAIVTAAQGIPDAVDGARATIDAFFNTPLGVEVQQGAQVVADYFSGPFQENLSNGVAVVQGKLDEFAASDWGQRIQAGAGVVADYMANDFASDFQAGVQIASDALAPFAASAELNFNASMEAAGIVADYMMNDFPTDFQAGVDLVVGFVTGLPGQVQAGWDELVSTAAKAGDDMLASITSLGPRALAAGRGFIGNIKEGITGAFDGLMSEFKAKLDALTSLLTGSEPKDTSSPLYGLGRRGAALVGNFAEGVLESTALEDALAAVTRQGREALEEFVAEVDRIAGEAAGGALGVRRGGIAAIGAQISSQQSADKALADAQAANAGALKVQEQGAKDAAAIREEARKRDVEAAKEIAEIEAEAARLRYSAANNIDPEKREDAAARAAELEAELIALREERGVAAAEAEAEAKEREADALAEVVRLQNLAVDKNMEYVAYTEQNAKTQAAINEALAQTRSLATIDPVAANQYLNLRQRQIKEIADYQLKADLAQDDRTKALIAQQQELLAQAQQIEAAQLAESIRARAGELGAAGRAVTTQVASTIAASTSYTTVGSGNTINVNGAGAGAAQLAQMLLAILNGQAGRADIFARTQ